MSCLLSSPDCNLEKAASDGWSALCLWGSPSERTAGAIALDLGQTSTDTVLGSLDFTAGEGGARHLVHRVS